MKFIKTVSILIIALIILNSCKKSSSTISNTSIVGNWELRQSYGDIGTVNYPAGNNSTFKFASSTYFISDTTHSFIFHGSHPQTGFYKIINDNSAAASTGILISAGQFTNRIIFDNDTASEKIFIQITNNTLEFLSGPFPVDGGYKLTYQKN